MAILRTLAHWFPVPHVLAPCGTGVDVSDGSVKWLTLAPTKHGTRVRSFGSETIPSGAVHMGTIQDVQALADVLRRIRTEGGVTCAHAALPEEGAFVFTMHVPFGTPRTEIIHMIEFELESRVPIPPDQTVYDYDVITRDDAGEEISVVVFPQALAYGYVEAFSRAGIHLMSLEIEARSVARAATDPHEHAVHMLVDCGKARTGIAIVKRGIPTFTSTVEIGGDTMSAAVIEAMKLPSEAEAETFKNEQGLLPRDPAFEQGRVAVEKVAHGLADEIVRHYQFWDSRREGTMSMAGVFLLGGGSNLRGFPDLIAGKVHAPADRPNVWRMVASFDEYIPPIEYRASFQYATAIGLALRSII